MFTSYERMFAGIELRHRGRIDGLAEADVNERGKITSGAGAGLSRRSFFVLGGGVGVALLTGCAAGANDSDGDGGGAASDTLRVAVSSYPGSWDQDFVGFDLLALALFKNTMPYLVDYGVGTVDGARMLDTANIQPSFAKSFTADDSGKVWTLKLRKGVKFPSGNELTAADVKWSKDRASRRRRTSPASTG